MSKKEKRVIERWEDSQRKVGFWRVKKLMTQPFPAGILFANNQWWMFGGHRPGLELPVWLRTEAWIRDHAEDREAALIDIGNWWWAASKESEQALWGAQYPTPELMRAFLLARVLQYEKVLLDAVYEIIVDPAARSRHRWLTSFQIRVDRPEPS